jgi:hypothetical protein
MTEEDRLASAIAGEARFIRIRRLGLAVYRRESIRLWPELADEWPDPADEDR